MDTATEIDSLINQIEREEIQQEQGQNELRFVQISCVQVANVAETQTVAWLYGLTADGVVWSKRWQDLKWEREPMAPLEPPSGKDR